MLPAADWLDLFIHNHLWGGQVETGELFHPAL